MQHPTSAPHCSPSTGPALFRLAGVAMLALLPMHAALAQAYRFAFGDADAPPGYHAVGSATRYDKARGYGLEPDAGDGKQGAWRFVVDLPEGNYLVTMDLGDDRRPAATTVRAELRRLFLEGVRTAPGEHAVRAFTVNVRTPDIPAAAGVQAGAVALKAPRETVIESSSWDRRLSFEIGGTNPSVRTIDIAPVGAPTLFLLGDSTVCDQPGEPYTSWGQMLPRFLKPGIAVANYAMSGQTYRDALSTRRVDKIVATLKPGDLVAMQYGHNDQKQIAAGTGGPYTTYKAEIGTIVERIRARGGVPIVISPMERRIFDAHGTLQPALRDYADAARQAAAEAGVPFIDLNAMSSRFYSVLGAEGSKAAFVDIPDKPDNSHHSQYGAYMLAKFVANALRSSGLPMARFVSDDLGTVDPARPAPLPDAFDLPRSTKQAVLRPLGD